jgi:hypothetical protein
VADLHFTTACCDTGMTAKDGYDIEAAIVSVAARSFDWLGPAEIQAAAPLFP